MPPWPLQSFVYATEYTGMSCGDRLLDSDSYTMDIIKDIFYWIELDWIDWRVLVFPLL